MLLLRSQWVSCEYPWTLQNASWCLVWFCGVAHTDTKMRVVCVETGEDFGSVTCITKRVSGKHKGSMQAVTTDRIMEVRYYPKQFVAFYNMSRGIYESKFVKGTFKIN